MAEKKIDKKKTNKISKKANQKTLSRNEAVRQENLEANSNSWKQRDESMLLYAVNDKIKEIDREIADSSSPNHTARLKDQKKAYQNVQKKLYSGNYGSEDLYKKLKRAGVRTQNTNVKGRESAYDQMDFRFDEYFRKTRYYGVSLPIINIVFIALVVIILFFSLIFPSSTVENISSSLSGINVVSLYSYKLGEDTLDFLVENDGDFPQGSYMEGKERLYEPYIPDGEEEAPGVVRLYGELGLQTLDITMADIIKGLVQTKPFSAYDISAIKNNEKIDGADAFYARFIFEKSDYLQIKKNSEGQYEKDKIIYCISVYATLYSYVGIGLCLVVGLLSSVLSLFTYTGRRLHVYAILLIIFSLIALIMPAFLAIPYGLSSDYCLQNYFSMSLTSFMENETAIISVNIPVMICLAVGVIMLILPKIFRNKDQKLPGFVPAGNRPPTPSPVKKKKRRASR